MTPAGRSREPTTGAVRGKALVNALLFQLGWAICVLGGSYAAVLFVVPYLVCHFAWISDDSREWRFTLAAASAGILLDVLALRCGVFAFTETAAYPVWMVVLWVLFATLVPHGLGWLQGRWLMAALLGAAGGAGSYAAGMRVGVAEASVPSLAYTWWALQWALLLPALLLLARSHRLSSCRRRAGRQ